MENGTKCILYVDFPSGEVNHARKLAGVRRAADAFGWEVAILPRGETDAGTLDRLLRSLRPVGCVVEATGDRHELPPAIFGATPVVYLDPPQRLKWRRARAITGDNAAIARMVFRELSAGHPSLYAAVPHNGLRRWNRERISAFRALCLENGAEFRAFPGRRDEPDGERARRLSAWVAALPPRSWFPSAQMLVSRMAASDGARLAMSVNGGHNDEPHNHNDLGSYSIMLDGVEMGGDPGGEVYTERTFSALRYESRIINSYGHPVPVVDLKLQGVGRQFAAKVLMTGFSDAKDEIVYDLTGAYPECSLVSLTRRVSFDRVRREITVTDAARFSKPSQFEVPFVTCRDWEKASDGSFVFKHPGGGRKLLMAVASSAPVVLREEMIGNPGRPDVTRLGFSFVRLVAEATLTMSFSIA